jgi:hypothetical protein
MNRHGKSRHFRAVDNTGFHILSVISIARTMPTLTVIKHFDVIKKIAAGFFPRSVSLFLYPFAFQQLEKAFCNRKRRLSTVWS